MAKNPNNKSKKAAAQDESMNTAVKFLVTGCLAWLYLMIVRNNYVNGYAEQADPKKKNHSDKMIHLVLWIIPVMSVVLHTITYLTALGYGVRMEVVMPVLMGLIFAIIGNYLPKCKQNYTIGIKIPWTLDNEENWNKTHRFAGWLWTFCGVAIMLTGFLGSFWIFLPIALLMVIVPVLYSYLLHRKGL